MKRIISSVLALLMLVGCLSSLITVNVSAEIIGGTPETGNYLEALDFAFNQAYKTGAEKLAGDKNMVLMARQYGYELYCNRFTGEVAYKNIATGEILTSNPYDFTNLKKGSDKYSTDNTITRLLSQIEVSFRDNEDKEKTFYSFVEAANRNQITVKNITNGIRVEYVMGRLSTTYLLPGAVVADDFRTHVLIPLIDKRDEIEAEFTIDSKVYAAIKNEVDRMQIWFVEWNAVDMQLADVEEIRKQYKKFGNITVADGTVYDVTDEAFKAALDAGQVQYEEVVIDETEALERNVIVSINGQAVTDDHSVYYILSDGSFGDKNTVITEMEKAYLENAIRTYLTDFDQELLDEINSRTGYVQINQQNPVFRMALEYTLQKDGLAISLPATSIRFDESTYTLQYVRMLQYFGAGNLNNEGYVFFPDGSGALVEFKEFYSSTNEADRTVVDLTAAVYGEDYAYYSIDEDAKHSEIIRMPVYGIQQNKNGKDGGFIAIMEEGDSLADISVSFASNNHYYASAYTTFFPRPYDTYNMMDAISVGDNTEWTVVSDKKYEGTYRLKIVMLHDESDKSVLEAAASTVNYDLPYYEASYIGMAKAYREYLVSGGYIAALTEADVKADTPLYIETFGSIKTVRKILSFPVTVDTPLTTFEDVEKMYDSLALKGIKNINFKLTGYANGGLIAKYPKKLKWVRALGGKGGFTDLIAHATEKGFGVYPEFDFSYLGDGGINLKRNAAKAVDDRYCSKQIYDPVYQEFSSYFDICISPSSIFSLVERFSAKFSKFNPMGISVSTMASDLNSDFNEDNPQNREDAKGTISETLSYLEKSYGSVMSEGGNIYTLRYLDHLLGAPIDSSKYTFESKTVPFWGIVLHGYEQYAGSVINEAGDGDYQLLKSIENGAYLYYLLSYQNTNLMKEDSYLSQYYSLRFDIWFNDVVEKYGTLNNALAALQTYTIEDHKFLIGERVTAEGERDKELEKINDRLASFLANKYASLKGTALRELNVKQMAVNAINAGAASLAAVEADIAYRLGEELTETDKANVAAVWQSKQPGQPLPTYDGIKVGVVVDAAALIASLDAILGDGYEPTAKQIQLIEEFAAANSCKGDATGAFVLTMNAIEGIEFLPSVTDSFATDGADYKATLYTVNSDDLVMVTYQKGTETVRFVINYNLFDVEVKLDGVNGGEAFVVSSYGFRQINGNTLVDANN